MFPDTIDAETSRGDIIHCRVHGYGTTHKFRAIVAHSEDNPGQSLDYMRLGEVHIDTLTRCATNNRTLKL